MRIRATVAALSGTLALSALAVPAAQAADGPNLTQRETAIAKAAADESEGDTKITKVVVNKGKDIVVGTTNKVKFDIAITATDAEGIFAGDAFLWHGSDIDNLDGFLFSEDSGTCTAVNATTATCTVSVVVDPKLDLFDNVLAGKWKVAASAIGNDGDYYQEDNFSSNARIQRYARLTTNASPEPIKKGKTLTVSGALTRANWYTSKYAGYTKQDVKLQYKKKGASSYSTLKTVKSDSKGNLKTTVKASADGYFRYVFAGTSTTPAVTSKSDFVDVQ
ncbi:calcium-binding protein [Streptomyces alfalfae]|uniref:Calcium-binding protein n=1 Tax=Streptomyces alfalfae TaxID=1642299 RepID=A0ABN4VJ61_9ACTN|nr:calcium-binding protein [Streptomyces alfalfae]AYA18087.1 calcium-binding protein [Streptomyces fradiae]APY87666.1 calcium-binding protein [Streptomyces alfalfae]QUI32360.1 calcium-binding protein [Streptomyces alfalfae]RXX40205.1 calcium-binding protein [Streptomyces alfalfae]RZM87545.1 calcium-binding protein [Streptomyces alfalfae]